MSVKKNLLKTVAISAIAVIGAIGTTAQADEANLDIVFINDGHVAPYHVAWLTGFEDAIAAYNEEFGNVTGRWLSAEGSLERMIQQAEATINEGPDVMFVNAINTEAFEPLVAQAQEAGISWVAVHSPMDSADYSFTLGDVANGRNQGLAMCALLGEGTVGVMLGQAGNPSGEARRAGILEGLASCDTVEVVAEQPADWDTVRAQSIAENWLTQFPDLTAISGVTDAYLYPSIAIAQGAGRDELRFFGYDGDIPILQQMQGDDAPVLADILLSGTREGWNFVQMAYRIHRGDALEHLYDFYTPLVMTEENHALALENGFPADIEVYSVDQALEVAEFGYLEFGPDSVQ
jgi:ABC-type sugar transport system substrate-binding protein